LITKPLVIQKIRNTAIISLIVFIAVQASFLHYVLGYNWLTASVDSLISNFLLSICCIVLSTLLSYYRPKDEPVLFVLVITIVLSVFIVFAGKYVLTLINDDPAYIRFLSFTIWLRFLIVFIFLAWCALANILWYKLEEQSEMQNRLFATQTLAKEAELNKLRHQLQPHFLFNSLNSVYALTIVNPKEAGVMITKLASFLRGTLKRDDEVWVSVREEMEYIQLYLDIEKVRFSHRLNINVKIDEDTYDLRLPGTLLQPIVENAIKFGLYNTSAPILISIFIKARLHMLEITVENPFDIEMTKGNGAGTGFGLASIRRRLYLLFADETLLKTETKDECLYITTLKIPQTNDKNNLN
jgi:two-component system LytT family sensor kinase